MILLLLIGLILVGTAVWLIARSVSINRLRAAERLDQITSYGFSEAFGATAPTAPSAAGPRERQGLDETVGKAVAKLGASVVTRVPGQSEPRLRKLLDEAGKYRTATARFAGFQALLGVGLPAFWLL